MYYRAFITIFTALFLAACSNSDPGPLKGRWKASGFLPMEITFREGETEVFGIIEKVSYEIEGNSVRATEIHGIFEGDTIRYKIINKNSISLNGMVFHRIK